MYVEMVFNLRPRPGKGVAMIISKQMTSLSLSRAYVVRCMQSSGPNHPDRLQPRLH